MGICRWCVKEGKERDLLDGFYRARPGEIIMMALFSRRHGLHAAIARRLRLYHIFFFISIFLLEITITSFPPSPAHIIELNPSLYMYASEHFPPKE